MHRRCAAGEDVNAVRGGRIAVAIAILHVEAAAGQRGDDAGHAGDAVAAFGRDMARTLDLIDTLDVGADHRSATGIVVRRTGPTRPAEVGGIVVGVLAAIVLAHIGEVRAAAGDAAERGALGANRTAEAETVLRDVTGIEQTNAGLARVGDSGAVGLVTGYGAAIAGAAGAVGEQEVGPSRELCIGRDGGARRGGARAAGAAL